MENGVERSQLPQQPPLFPQNELDSLNVSTVAEANTEETQLPTWVSVEPGAVILRPSSFYTQEALKQTGVGGVEGSSQAVETVDFLEDAAFNYYLEKIQTHFCVSEVYPRYLYEAVVGDQFFPRFSLEFSDAQDFRQQQWEYTIEILEGMLAQESDRRFNSLMPIAEQTRFSGLLELLTAGIYTAEPIFGGSDYGGSDSTVDLWANLSLRAQLQIAKECQVESNGKSILTVKKSGELMSWEWGDETGNSDSGGGDIVQSYILKTLPTENIAAFETRFAQIQSLVESLNYTLRSAFANLHLGPTMLQDALLPAHLDSIQSARLQEVLEAAAVEVSDTCQVLELANFQIDDTVVSLDINLGDLNDDDYLSSQIEARFRLVQMLRARPWHDDGRQMGASYRRDFYPPQSWQAICASLLVTEDNDTQRLLRSVGAVNAAGNVVLGPLEYKIRSQLSPNRSGEVNLIGANGVTITRRVFSKRINKQDVVL